MLEGHIVNMSVCCLAYANCILNFIIYNGYPGYRNVARGYKLQLWFQEMQALTDLTKLSEKKNGKFAVSCCKEQNQILTFSAINKAYF